MANDPLPPVAGTAPTLSAVSTIATQSAIVGPPAAIRGAVQKTFVRAKLLAGFFDDAQRMAQDGEYVQGLALEEQQRQHDAAAAARSFVATLTPMVFTDVVVRPVVGQHVQDLENDATFRQLFGQRPHQFAYVHLSQLIALQTWVEPRGDLIPSNEAALIAYTLPPSWEVPAEVTFIQPAGPIQIMTSSPAMQNVRMDFDPKAGTVLIGPQKHINLIQVLRVPTPVGPRSFLVNGYHRVVDAIAAGRTELPALVIEAMMGPAEIPFFGQYGFVPAFVVGAPRPPLVSDFQSAAAILTQVRERRYGVLLEFTTKPLVIGI